ncbi:MAG: Atg14 domain-containing protein [Sedimenticola sp.]|uniref:Uncharacterized protein n=1 Tax=Sedimenticola thiotaurini TaxID=1543721 RepID=A0A558DAL1_9GAMM|nr:Atg14 domain-containing protein [Sedimenticola sp.]MCW8947269.1 Atg14 domain-containing protein [Sedimenticola sp.]MCW8950079.1 Atg14 domain-containing protein [Sedimenticola sp.]MCW8974555.1 Atg14 domain-containing protein [Sedimenticola sp.]TVT58039.1 MAG: hypothetical protein FHK82_04805 [Sedimenticola thiotaurini]
MKITTPKIVQSRSRWVYLWGVVPIVLGAVLLVGWQGYLPQLSPVKDIDQISPLQKRIKEQAQEIASLEEERGHLREQIAALERAGQIDKEAMREVREELKQSRSSYMEMENELALLRGIVETSIKSEGLYIQGFRLDKSEEAQLYRYRFTVSQSLKNAGAAVGWIELALEGEKDGEPSLLPLKEITKEKDEKLKMRFRHFQDVDGLIQLPEGFNPERVIVEINPTNNKLPQIKKTFDWLVAE